MTQVTIAYKDGWGVPQIHARGCGDTKKAEHTNDIELDPVATTLGTWSCTEGSKDAYVIAWTRHAFSENAPENGEIASGKVAPCIGTGRQTCG